MGYRAIERWQQLAADQSRTTGIPSIDSGVSSGYGQIRFALGSDGEWRLLIPIGSDARPDELPSSANLRITVVRLTLQRTALRYADMQCCNRQLNQVFAELVDAILSRIEHGSVPLSAIAGAMAEFRELLRDECRARIPIERVLGLIGELHVLSMLSTYSVACVAAWTGPFEQRHDFRRGLHAIEVKTSARVDASRVHINGIEQLAEPTGGELLLVHVRLERTDAGPLTVGMLFQQLVQAGVNSHVLGHALAQLGCDDPFDLAWNETAWTLEGVTGYAVTQGFPRLVSTSLLQGSLPAGVAHLGYELDLSVAASFAQTQLQFETFLKEMMT